MASPVREIARIIKNNDGFLIASHYNPDGDAIGSTVALGFILKALGKKFIMYNPSGLPERFNWVDMPGPFLDVLPDEPPQWTFVLDCGNAERSGSALVNFMEGLNVVNIDHHVSNPEFGTVNWVDMKQPSVGSMIAQLARELDIPLSEGLGEAVYLALATDTGFFTYGSTTAESHDLAAEILRLGLEPGPISAKITNQWSLNRMRLWHRAIGKLELHHDKLTGLVCITKEDFTKTGAAIPDTEGLINIVRRLRGIRISAILRENGAGVYKFSLRSHGKDNVQAIAATFGGGGHINAAGGQINADLDSAKKQLLAAIGEALNLV